jgi:anti-sigma factor RsiW
MTARNGDSTVGRLVGSAAPELFCDECFEKLDEYVELELRGAPADERIPGMRPHLDGCPACREEHASLRELVRAGDARHRPA